MTTFKWRIQLSLPAYVLLAALGAACGAAAAPAVVEVEKPAGTLTMYSGRS